MGFFDFFRRSKVPAPPAANTASSATVAASPPTATAAARPAAVPTAAPAVVPTVVPIIAPVITLNPVANAPVVLPRILEQASNESDVSLGERRRKLRNNARPGTRVLVVDDSPTIIVALKRMLEQNKLNVLEAITAEQALEIAFAQPPDLIFLDIVLPGMSGFNALRALRRDPRTQKVPIIMISGNEQATEEFYVQRIGADDFMKKPFSRAEVFARIERMLDADAVPRRNPVFTFQGMPTLEGTTTINPAISNGSSV